MVFNTEIGEVALIWDGTNDVIKQVILPDESGKYNYSKNNFSGVLLEEDLSDHIMSIVEGIKDVVRGVEVNFDDVELDFSDLTEFQREVLQKQLEIPYQRVITYKMLAHLIGKDKSARPVANALASNPFPLIIPCHRTVRADWHIGGYNGTSDGSVKKFLLEHENVQFDKDVVKKRYRLTCDNSRPSMSVS
ncbi:methylated-DNA--[protein]-cysteine S-methyltransferase [Methanosphaera cuniculi]|uniref:methylated-DNA--[protein]-cysteine S-methyltransferase n=1 Tax=Methanosphaera cuniculi TaxID=1077256 RepID=UPI0026EF8593|nr:MGMT family protein [Methanosphaera cuniculi]